MYVLHSFSTGNNLIFCKRVLNCINLHFLGAIHSLGKEQFVAMYLSAGVVSSFTSYLYKILTKQPGLSLGAVSIYNC